MAEKIQPGSSWNYKPTPKQVRQITKLASQLHIQEPVENTPTTRLEARNLIYKLREQVKKQDT